MIKVEGRNLWRGGTKIGYVGHDYILDHAGEKVGFFAGNHIMDRTGHKIAEISGDYILVYGGQKIRIEDNNRDVIDGELSNVERAAVRLTLGE